MNSGSKLLVTGATGFVGSPLVTQLVSKGWSVIALNRQLGTRGSWQRERPFDLANPVIPRELFEGVNAVVHLAGIAHTTGHSAEEYAQNNTRASISLALQALNAGVKRFIYFSSSRVIPDDENNVGSDPYALSKADAELGLRRMSREQGLQLTIVRPSLVYGVGVKANLYKLLKAIKLGWMPPLPKSKGGISMISSYDVCTAIEAILNNDSTVHKIYGLDDGEVYNPRRIYRETRQAMNKPIPGWSVPMPLLEKLAGLGDALSALGLPAPLTSPSLRKLFADSALQSTDLTEDTGWRPVKRLRDVLPEMLESL